MVSYVRWPPRRLRRSGPVGLGNFLSGRSRSWICPTLHRESAISATNSNASGVGYAQTSKAEETSRSIFVTCATIQRRFEPYRCSWSGFPLLSTDNSHPAQFLHNLKSNFCCEPLSIEAECPQCTLRSLKGRRLIATDGFGGF